MKPPCYYFQGQCFDPENNDRFMSQKYHVPTNLYPALPSSDDGNYRVYEGVYEDSDEKEDE